MVNGTKTKKLTANIAKRVVAALTISAALSALYIGVASANNESNTVYLTDIFDVVEIGPGYYEESTFIQNNIPTPETFVSAPYADGDNNSILSLPSTEAADTAIEDYHLSGNYDISVGIDEQLTLQPGYYYDPVTIKNGVKDNGDPSAILDGDNQYVELPKGYYVDGTIQISPTWNDLVTKLNSIFGTEFTGNESFESLKNALSGDNFAHNNLGMAKYTPKTEGTNTRIGASSAQETVPEVNLAGETIDLGVDETLVIPAGFYGAPITIQNGVLHQANVNTTVSANNNDTYGAKSVTYPAGYYDSIDVADATPNGKITLTHKGAKKVYDPVTKKWQ